MISIQRATKDDAKDILAITKLAFSLYKRELGSDDIGVKALLETEEDVLRDIKNNIVFVAKNTKVLGSIRIKKLTEDLAYIYRFAVHPSDNNSGVGSELLNYALEECRKLNFSAAALHTNTKYFKLARYYYGKMFYVHSTDSSRGYIRALFVKEITGKQVDLSAAFKE